METWILIYILGFALCFPSLLLYAKSRREIYKGYSGPVLVLGMFAISLFWFVFVISLILGLAVVKMGMWVDSK